jgi:hypothetical protein
MSWQTSVLVVANVTADSDELLEALRSRAERGPLRATLLVPARGPGPEGREAAKGQIEAALERFRDAGIEAEGEIGDCDPITAVHEAWDPKRYDEVIVSTLAAGASRWLAIDLPHRVERITGVQVSHVVSKPKRRLQTVPPREHEKHGILSALAPLPWQEPEEKANR